MNTIQMFFTYLEMATNVTIDDGAILSDWDVEEELTGQPDNQIVRFSWTDGDCDYADILTEGGIANGTFSDDGKFVCWNSEGEKVVIRFFKIERITAIPSMPLGHERFAVASRCETAHIQMQDVIGNYDTPDAVPEWKWVAQASSFAHVDNGKDGVWEFVVNMANPLTDIPESLLPIIQQARQNGLVYLVFHQGT